MSRAFLMNDLVKAREDVIVGARYSHYKNPDKYYRVVDLGIDEATDKVTVIYRDDMIVWVRLLEVWKEMVEHNGEMVPRFSRVL